MNVRQLLRRCRQQISDLASVVEEDELRLSEPPRKTLEDIHEALKLGDAELQRVTTEWQESLGVPAASLGVEEQQLAANTQAAPPGVDVLVPSRETLAELLEQLLLFVDGSTEDMSEWLPEDQTLYRECWEAVVLVNTETCDLSIPVVVESLTPEEEETMLQYLHRTSMGDV